MEEGELERLPLLLEEGVTLRERVTLALVDGEMEDVAELE